MEENWLDNETPAQFLARIRASPEGKGGAMRSDVAKLALKDPAQALKVARLIEHPWYRCQAITGIVEVNPSHREAESLLDEAFVAAYSQDEPNRIANVSRWPLRQLVSRGSPKAKDQTLQLLQVIAKESHGLRRLDGVSAILSAVAPSSDLRSLVLQPFMRAAEVSHGWRTERIIDFIATILLPFDRKAVVQILSLRPPSRYTKRSRAKLAEAQRHD